MLDETPIDPIIPINPIPPIPPGAPWDFLDLVFTLMIVLGSLFLCEALLAAALAVHVAGTGPGGPRVSDLLSEVRFQLPVQFVSYALTVWFVLMTARVKYQRSLLEDLQWRTLGEIGRASCRER